MLEVYVERHGLSNLSRGRGILEFAGEPGLRQAQPARNTTVHPELVEGPRAYPNKPENAPQCCPVTVIRIGSKMYKSPQRLYQRWGLFEQRVAGPQAVSP